MLLLFYTSGKGSEKLVAFDARERVVEQRCFTVTISGSNGSIGIAAGVAPMTVMEAVKKIRYKKREKVKK